MAEIAYSQSPGSYNLQTQGTGFTTPGYNSPDWAAFFDAAAQKKADAAAEEKRRWNIENHRKEEMLQRQQNLENQARAEAQRKAAEPPRTEWTDAPMMRSGFSYTGPSANVRVKKDSSATQDIGYGMGMRGY